MPHGVKRGESPVDRKAFDIEAFSREALDKGTPISQPPGVNLFAANLAYGGRTLFRDLALDLPAGVVTALLGPSGVGKSTLLRLIAGLTDEESDKSTSGLGASGLGASGLAGASDGRPLHGRIAWMAQQDLLLPWLSVLDNVLLGWRLRGAPRRQWPVSAARAALDEVGLGALADRRPAGLSGGERQRAALVRTLMENRPVVLMDEPFSALDAITRLKLQDMAARLLVGRTVLLVTHDPLEALRLAHRVVVMTGAPARLSEPLIPAGAPPRPPAAPGLLDMQAQLLERLSQ